ncbi:MAG TPA: substrate-binding domain-containing protein [Steroidobacteraceae bacterium]|nr:substrate-binding domain-containing protein [Steroidobacteraceae bacterium]
MTLSKMTQIGAAVAALLGASSAFALDQATTNASTTTKLVAAGSSAARDAFLVIMANEICVPNTLDVYRANPTTNQDFRAYSCTLKPSSGAGGVPELGNAGGKNVTLFYRSEGGSAWGAVSIATNTQVMALDTTDATCAASSSASFTVGSTTITAPTHNCSVTGYNIASDTRTSGALTLKTVDLGVGDEEPKMFTGANFPSSSRFAGVNTPASQNLIRSLNKSSGFGQVFGILLNTTGPNTSLISSLTKQDIASIFTGNYVDWSQIPGLSLPGGPITVVRREPGSGTQVAAGAYFAGVNCGSAYTFVTDSDAPGAPDTDGVIEVATTSSMESTVGATPDAIGLNVYKNPAPANTKYVQINGAAPDRTLVARPYDFAYELSLSKRTTLADASPVFPSSFANALIAIAKKGTLVPDVVSVFAIPSSASTNVPGSTQAGRPVAFGTRNGNSCLPFQGL